MKKTLSNGGSFCETVIGSLDAPSTGKVPRPTPPYAGTRIQVGRWCGIQAQRPSDRSGSQKFLGNVQVHGKHQLANTRRGILTASRDSANDNRGRVGPCWLVELDDVDAVRLIESLAKQ